MKVWIINKLKRDDEYCEYESDLVGVYGDYDKAKEKYSSMITEVEEEFIKHIKEYECIDDFDDEEDDDIVYGREYFDKYFSRWTDKELGRHFNAEYESWEGFTMKTNISLVCKTVE